MNNLKISINVQNKEGPWGGGNLFITNLKNYLESKGNKVIFDLFDEDIDIILIIDPRMLSESVIYSIKDIQFYKRSINSECKVIHRINECDERKGTLGINKYYIEANKIADYTVFVSEWLKNTFIKSGFSSKNNEVIMSGSDSEIFNDDGRLFWDGTEPLKIVTHHWGNDLNKGFDIYQYLDENIQKKFKNKIEFTYIGNTNNNIEFKSTNVIQPKSGIELANLIKKNHIYLTASINEPSGNHHIEGAQCGLPIIYRESGGIPEFAHGFGVGFQGIEDFIEAVEEIQKNYDDYFHKMKNYPFNSSSMSRDYLDLFYKVLSSDFHTESARKETNIISIYFQNFSYYINKFLNIINLYNFKVKIKKYLLIKFPIFKNEKNVV